VLAPTDVSGSSQAGDASPGARQRVILGPGRDENIYGDSGVNFDVNTRVLTIPTAISSTNPNRDNLVVGNDNIHGVARNDITSAITACSTTGGRCASYHAERDDIATGIRRTAATTKQRDDGDDRILAVSGRTRSSATAATMVVIATTG